MTRRAWGLVRAAATVTAVATLGALGAACDDRPAVPEPARTTPASSIARPNAAPNAAPSDSATLLYREAREALTRGDSTTAVHGFEQVFMQWPQSARAPHAMYWKAFMLYRRGGAEALVVAHRLLDLATQMAPASYAVGDAATLLLRVRYRLAVLGDRDALRELGLPGGAAAAACESEAGADRLAWALDPAQPADARLERLRALVAERAPCSAHLREQALLLLAREPNGAGVPDLLAAARGDDAPAVRRSALRAIPRPAPNDARSLLERVLATANDVTSLEAAAAAWASRPDWGTEPLRAFLRRPGRNETAADYVHTLLAR